MKKKILVLSISVLFILCCVVGIYKINSICQRVENIYERIQKRSEYSAMDEKKVDLSVYEPLEDEENAWYTKYHFIAHAGGEIDGKTYTNSVQAWTLSYEKGNRVFDADMNYTSDGVMVLRHDWNDNLEQGVAIKDSTKNYTDRNGMNRFLSPQEQMDYKTFMSTKMYYKYDGMSCEDMLEYMADHEDLYVATDMKGNMAESYRYLVDTAKKLNLEEVLDRIIVNIYDFDTYDSIMEVHDFKNVTARQQYVDPQNYYELIQFCVTHNIHVVNISSCYMDDENVKLFKEYGIHTYVAITDYISDMKEYRALGADGAVTNWLCESDWNYVE